MKRKRLAVLLSCSMVLQCFAGGSVKAEDVIIDDSSELVNEMYYEPEDDGMVTMEQNPDESDTSGTEELGFEAVEPVTEDEIGTWTDQDGLETLENQPENEEEYIEEIILDFAEQEEYDSMDLVDDSAEDNCIEETEMVEEFLDFTSYDAIVSGDYEYIASGDTATITKYTGSGSIIMVPSSLDGYTVTKIGDNAFINNGSIKSVFVQEGITAVGNGAFYNCSSLENLYLPDTLTSVGYSVIAGTSVASITIPKNVTSGGIQYYLSYNFPGNRNDAGAMTGCETLRQVIFAEGTEKIPSYFCWGADNLSSVVIPDTVQSIGNFAFGCCSSLTSIELPQAPLTLGGGIFSATPIDNLEIPKETTCSRFYVNNFTFYPLTGCTDLGTLSFEEGTEVIPSYIGYNTYAKEVVIPLSATTIGDSAFEKSYIDHIRIPGNVKTIGIRAFQDCQELKHCDLEEGIVEIGREAFRGCSVLEELDLPESLNTLGALFIGGTSLTDITIPLNVMTCNTYTSGITYGPLSECTTLVNICFQDGITGIPDYACYNSTFQNVVIPQSVQSIGKYAFCKSKVTSVRIPGNVKMICDNAFDDCTSLSSCELEEGVETLGAYAFKGCSLLTEFVLPESLTTLKRSIFSGSALKSITIPKGITTCEVKYGNAICSPFEGCTSLESAAFEEGTIQIPDYIFYNSSVKSITIPDSVDSIGAGAFYISGLIEVTIPDGVKTIGKEAFKRCTALEKIVLPASLTTISEYMFDGDSSLVSCIIPDGVTSIEQNVFSNCKALSSIHIPDSVKTIGNSAFMGSGLTEIVIPDTVETIGTYAFSSCSNLKSVEVKNSVRKLPVADKVEVKEVKDEDPDTHTMDLSWELVPEKSLVIKERAFQGCSVLEKLILANTVKTIEGCVFLSCPALSEVTFSGTESEWSNMEISTSGNTQLLNAERIFKANEEDKVSGCEIWISTNGEFYKPQKVRVPYSSEETYQKTITAEEKEKTYYIKIRAYKSEEVEGGSLLHLGNWCDTATLSVENPVTAMEVKRSVEKFYGSMDTYLKLLGTEAKADEKNYQSNGTTKGQLLREADDKSNNKLLTFPMTSKLTDRQKDVVYDVLAEYMEQTSELKIDKINVSSSTSLDNAAKTIVNKVQENIIENSGVFAKHTGIGLVELNLKGASGSFTGEVLLNGKLVAVCNSGIKGTWTTLTNYIKNLREVVNDLMYQSLTSIFKELGSVTGISDYVNKDIDERMNGLEDDLLRAGYGGLQKRLVMLKDCNKVLKDIKAAATKETLEEVLTDSKKIWKEIDSMDFSDSAVKNTVLKEMSTELENQKKDLAKTLYAYAYGLEKEAPTSRIAKIIRKCIVNCPVDVVVYNTEGSIVGSICNGVASYQPEITMIVQGNTKLFWMDAGQSYTVEFIGTGTGTMNYVMQDVQLGEVTDQSDYYSVPLEDGIIYRQSMYGGPLVETASNIPLVSDRTSVVSSNHLDKFGNPSYVSITSKASEGGTVSGDNGSIEKGTQACVKAEPDTGYRFIGWYCGEEIKSTDSAYYFVASGDVELEARFAKKITFDPDLGTVLEPKYRDSIEIYLIEDSETEGTTPDKLVFYLDSDAESIVILLKKYTPEGGVVSTEQIELFREELYKYVSGPIDLTSYGKVEIFDTEGNFIATILPKDQIPPESCGEGNHEFEIMETEKATCALDGYQKLKCCQCGEEKTVTLPATGRHTWNSGVVTKTASCTVNGEKVYTCSVCKLTCKETIKAVGHNYGSWVTVAKATVFAAEQQQRTCTRCRKTEARVVGTKLSPTMKVNTTSFPLKVKQSTTKLKVSGLAAGDYIKSWKSSNTKIVKVNSKGKISALNKTGKVTITITLASGLKKSIKVTVQKNTVKTKKISGVGKKLTLKKGAKKTLAPIITPITSLEKVKFKSSNTKIAVVSAKGVITAKKAGTAKIAVSSGSKKVTLSVKVTK